MSAAATSERTWKSSTASATRSTSCVRATPDEPVVRLKTFVPDRPGHDRRYAINATKIRRELGWSPRHTFESGLRETVRWYLEHRDWCAKVQAGKYERERLGLG